MNALDKTNSMANYCSYFYGKLNHVVIKHKTQSNYSSCLIKFKDSKSRWRQQILFPNLMNQCWRRTILLTGLLSGRRISRDAKRSYSLSYGELLETFEMLIVAKNWSKIHPTIHISQHKVRLQKFFEWRNSELNIFLLNIL